MIVNPKMIVLARDARGFTQNELARKLSIPQSTLSKIESGFLQVKPELLEKLSHALRFPKRFFSINEEIYGPGLSGMNIVYTRKRANTPKRVVNKIVAEMNLKRIHISFLLMSMDLKSKYKFPQLDVDEYEGDISEIANAVRAAWNVPQGPIHNLTNLIENAGGIVIECKFGTYQIDALSQWHPGLPPVFYINQDAPGDRIRFSLAHELGHIIMHRMPNPNMEEEANIFAGEFLMPKRDISPHFRVVNIAKLAQLKPYWKVSMAALLYRAHELGRISKRKYQYLWTQMAPYRKREPREIDIAVERPSLIYELLNAYLSEFEFSNAELANYLALEEDELVQLYFTSQRTRQAPHLKIIK